MTRPPDRSGGRSLLEAAVGLLQVVLVDDRGGVTMGETVLVAQPVDAIVEAQEPRPAVEMALNSYLKPKMTPLLNGSEFALCTHFHVKHAGSYSTPKE